MSYTPTGFPRSDAPVQLIVTGGDITGSIHCANFPDPSNSVTVPPSGIYARGHISADIDVDYTMSGNIIGQTITGEVRIGWFLEGMIVGWDDTGSSFTPLVSIGKRENPDPSYFGEIAGMTGQGDGDTGCPSWNFRSATDRNTLYDPDGLDCSDEGAYGAYIALHHVGLLEVASLLDGELGTGNEHSRAPSIECQIIDELRIDNFRDGSVWSGIFDDATSSGPPNNTNRTNDYAHIGTATIGCMGRTTQLWFDGTGSISVEKTQMGAIYAPTLEASGIVSIGAMGATYSDETPDEDRCGCALFGNCFVPRSTNFEASPRWTDISEYSSINIADPAGLHGQIILNAQGATTSISSLLRGVIALGAFDDAPTHLFSLFGPNLSDPHATRDTDGDHVLPYYTELPSFFGGGAIGVVPFAVHQKSSDALQERVTVPNNVLLNTELNYENYHQGCGQQDAVIDFYGGVTIPSGSTAPILLTLDGVYSVESKGVYAVQAAVVGGASRHLVIRPASSAYFPSGMYESSLTTVGPLLCAGLSPSGGDIAADPLGIFNVVLDCPTSTTSCDHDGEFDCIPDPPNTCTCVYIFCDSIDFNGDGLFPDTQDIDDFIDVFSGGTCPTGTCNDIDFNNDGLFPDTLDIDALISVFSGGPCLV